MKKLGNIILSIIVMAAAFVATAIIVNKFENREYENLTALMEDSTLPLVYVQYENQYINCLHGYRTMPDTTLQRDAITPVDENKSIRLFVDDKNDIACEAAYELRSIAGDSLIEDGTLEVAGQENGYDIYDINIRMDIKDQMEYMLVLELLDKDGEPIKYYTRVVIDADYHGGELLEFVKKFNEATFDFDTPKEASFISPYQESYIDTADTVIKGEMGHVTLADSYSRLVWSGVNPVKISTVMPTIKEIDTNYAVFEMSYMITDGNTEGDAADNYYSVKELYRVSYQEDGIHLMNFDRYIEEYFNRSEVDANNNVYEIGVSSLEKIEYRYSSDNKKLSFVRNGQLWMYNYSENEITMVFGFWLDDIANIRDTYAGHDINIISMDDDGNITFAVYGYMNRGAHEGRLGINLYEYDAKNMELNELLFVECNEPFAAMKPELSRLTYYDGENFYFMLGNKVNCINVGTKKMSYFVDNVSANHVFVSDNMEVMAYYSNDNQTENQVVTLVDLKQGTSSVLDAGAGKCLICYGFKDTDLIYGICQVSDAQCEYNTQSFDKLKLEEKLFDNIPAYKLFVVDRAGNQIKEYDKDELYIVNVTIDDDLLYMTRAEKRNDTFYASSDDFITFKEDESKPYIKVEKRNSPVGISKLYFTVPSNIYLTYVPYLNITKNKLCDEPVHMLVSIEDEYADYMVYDNFGLNSIYQVAGEAINAAVKVSGIVISKTGEVVYRQQEMQEYNTIASAIFHKSSGSVESSLQDCIYMTLIYEGATLEYDDLDGFSDAVNALTQYGKYPGADITGLSLSMVFGYVSDGVPVISRMGDGRYVLIVSYNSEAVRYYDPVKDEEVRTSLTSYKAEMKKWNNELYTFIKE